nr:PorT family protein [Prevotella sp.]
MIFINKRITEPFPSLGKICLGLLFFFPLTSSAQIGEHRNDFAVGVNGGYIMSSVGFTPDVSQGKHGGITGGLSVRYTCEKYFSTICSLYAEINYASLGWKENITDMKDAQAVNVQTGKGMDYSRSVNYVQIPLFAHLAWGREKNGLNFFFNIGPQFGYMISESTNCNFDVNKEIQNITDGTSTRSNTVMAQDTMKVENKFDYGIAGGIGLECSVPKMGHFLVEARYYYGLGNIYGNSKLDYFGKSNYGNIVIKAAYLFDLANTKK